MSVHELPCEILRNIFEHTRCQDVPKLRLVCQLFDDVIKRNYITLPRIAYVVRVFMENDLIFITHKKSGNADGSTQNIFEFDFNYWNEISIVELELQNIKCLSDNSTIRALNLIISQFLRTKQTELRKISLESVQLDKRHQDQLNIILGFSLRQCENVIVENCVLPINLTSNQIRQSCFDHFRFIDSKLETDLPSDLIIQKLQEDMRKTINKRSFLAELDAVKVETACNFIEEWLRLPVSLFFNLSFRNCDQYWKTKFLEECEKRKLIHNFMEFQSKTESNAHVKVSFSQDTKTCCIWPILDVPARTTGQSVCYARYFRDF